MECNGVPCAVGLVAEVGGLRPIYAGAAAAKSLERVCG